MINSSRSGLVLFSGNGNPALSEEISKQLGVKLGQAKVTTFSDGEISISIEENVRGKDVFLIQPTCAPAGDNLLELIIMVDALRRSSAGRITAVIPYYGYARQDRRVRSERVPISAKVMADILERSGIDRVLTVELHSEQIQGFFDIPVDNVYGTKVMRDDILRNNSKNNLVVSPDVGGVVRSRALAKVLGLSDLAIIDKRRDEANKSEVMNVSGEVAGKDCIIVDDIAISSTMIQSFPATSPLTFITSDLFASSLLLSIMARSDNPSTLAKALDLTTPPTSGDTTRLFLELLRRISSLITLVP